MTKPTCNNLTEGVTQHCLKELKPFTDYSVTLYAYVHAKVTRNGIATKCSFKTHAAGKPHIVMLLPVRVEENRVNFQPTHISLTWHSD